MAASMCVVRVMGNLGADPETRYTQKGTQITKFRIAQTKRVPDPKNEGEWKDDTHWFAISASGRLGEQAQERLSKGSRVMVVGDLSITEKRDDDGEKRFYLNVWATELYDLTPKERSNGIPLSGAQAAELPDPLDGLPSSATSARQPAPARQPAAAAPARRPAPVDEDELRPPF